MSIEERPIGSRRVPKRWLGPAHRLICTAATPLRASQRARRMLVAGLAVVLAAFPALAAATRSTVPVLLLFVPYMAGSLLLAGSISGLLDRPAASLDERQLSQRLTIGPEPYMTGASLGLVAGVTVAAATRGPEAMMLAVTLLAVLLLYGLPSMILAWRLPDEIDDAD